MNMTGKNLESVMRTFGPTSLSDIIFENNSAVRERTGKLVELQNKSNKYIKAPEKKITNRILQTSKYHK